MLHYSANVMNLAILGREPLATLSEFAEEMFSRIPNKAVPKLSTKNNPIFPESLQGSVVCVEPIKDLKELTLTWELPGTLGEIASHIETKVGNLVSHILGHEGKGSLISLLRRKELAEGLSAGKSRMGADNVLFEIAITLSDKGLQQWQTVVQLIFQAIASFRREAYPKYLFDELNHINKIGWEYQQRNPGMVNSYVKMLRHESLETFPEKSLFISRFDPDRIACVLDALKPTTCWITMVSKNPPASVGVSTNQTEQWMGAPYGVRKVTEAELAQWIGEGIERPHDEVGYPHPNIFIPENLSLRSAEIGALAKEHPVALVESKDGELIYYRDTEFGVPEILFNFNIKTPKIRPGNAESICLSNLYLRFVEERLNELSYDAGYAGLHYNVWISNDFFIMKAKHPQSRYNKKPPHFKAHKLLEVVLEKMKNPGFNKAEFDIFKDSLSRGYKNHARDPPINQAWERLSSFIYEEYATSQELANTIDTITLDSLVAFSADVFTSRYIEGFVGGNACPESDARRSWDLVREILPGTPCERCNVERPHVMSFDGFERPMLSDVELDVQGNALVWIAEVGRREDYQARIGHEMLVKMMREPFYSETGYIVSSGGFQADKRLFLQANVQSNTHDPRDLLARLELFAETFLRDLKDSPEVLERFETIKSSTLIKLRQFYNTLMAKLRHLQYLAYEEEREWRTLARRIEVLENFTVEDLREFGQKVLGRENVRRVAVLGRGNAEENRQFTYSTVNDVNNGGKASKL
ncbi:hypothetical protein HK102_008314 [Quaeritorhiza haematococci]|nr:hypothetical protein HK102_008314 [Quaeritorhiza haematococci]